MRTLFEKISDVCRRFSVSTAGVAAVEFALIMPLLLTLYIGSVEASRALIVDRKLTTIADSLGDLVARHDSSLTIADLNDYFEAAEALIAPYPDDSLKQVVTCVLVDEDGDATVVWSRGHNGGTPHEENTDFVLPPEFLAIANDTYVIVSEAWLDHEPLTTFVYTDELHLYKEYFHLPRFGELIQIDES